MKPLRTIHWPFLLCWIIAFCLFLVVGDDYGVAWDEHFQWVLGHQNIDYVLKGDRALLGNMDKDHGAGVELVLTGIEQVLGLKDDHDIYLMRHYVAHFFFLLCTGCGYMLVWRLFKNRWLALLTFLMLLLQPRLYAHSYFNTKDIPLLNTFLLGFLIAEWAFRRDRNIGYILLGLVCGFAISIRLTGLVLVGCLGLFLLIDLIAAIRSGTAWKKTRHLLLFLLCTAGSLYLCWPTLWEHPVNQLTDSWQTLTHFRWECKVLLNGNQYIATHLPWFYLPEWFCITMPELWLLAGLAGAVAFVIRSGKHFRQLAANTRERNFLLYFLCFAGPVTSVLLLHPVIYDDWRHFYFIYPAFVLLAVYGISLIPRPRLRTATAALLGVQTVVVLVFMIAAHPFQQVYFNNFVSHKDESLRKNFELDYWGVSAKQALEDILERDTSTVIRLVNCSTPIADNVSFLPPAQRKRFVIGEQLPAYFITHFRYHPQDFDYPHIFLDRKVLGSTIVRINARP